MTPNIPIVPINIGILNLPHCSPLKHAIFQVGVSLMLHSKRAESLKRKQQQQQGQADEPKKDTTESAKDSGYHTNNVSLFYLVYLYPGLL